MKLRYVEIETSKIYNRLAIENQTCWSNAPQWHDTWFEPETISLRKQFADIWREEFDKIIPHFNKLEQSIPVDGIKSPISLISGPPRDKFLKTPDYTVRGHYPPQYYSNLDNLLFVQPFGGSRVTVAEKLGIEKIPCVVHDFSNLFPDAPEVNQRNYRDWFDDNYMFCGQAPHIRDGAMNAQHRNAQQTASRIAKEKMNV